MSDRAFLRRIAREGGRLSANEQAVLREEWQAELIRYRECCLLLGTSPPTKRDEALWLTQGTPPGVMVPSDHSPRDLDTGCTRLQQLTNGARGRTRKGGT